MAITRPRLTPRLRGKGRTPRNVQVDQALQAHLAQGLVQFLVEVVAELVVRFEIVVLAAIRRLVAHLGFLSVVRFVPRLAPIRGALTC